jgi:DNA-binding NtrC family response regulator
MESNPVILLVDDDTELHSLLNVKLGREDFVVLSATNPAQCRLEMERNPALVLLDIRIPDGREGIELLREIKREKPALPVIMLSSLGDTKTVVESLKSGATDYFHKPDLGDPGKFAALVQNIWVELESSEKPKPAELPSRRPSYPGFEEIVGSSMPTRTMINLARLAAPENINVLLLGETGTGKEILARAIHYNSPRRDGIFVTINCSAIPEQLAESEFFGHVKGSFTGATDSRRGKFELADGGTLFLDEIGDMPLFLQAKLLRALQEKEITPVGANTAVRADCRIIAATNKELDSEVTAGSFREDLFYRISGFPIHLPRLKERKGDLPELIDHFVRIYNRNKPRKLAAGLLERLGDFNCRGNIRQLENMVQYALIVAGDKPLAPEHFPALKKTRIASGARSLAEAEKETIEQALRTTGYNNTHAARLLGISRPTLIKKIKEHGITEDS